MKSLVETLAPTRVKLSVEVPLAELRPSIDRAYQSIGAQVQVPGFRKGKVPPRIIDQRIGRGAVLQEAVNDALPELYAKAVSEASVRPLGRPEVEVTEVPDPSAQDGELKFTAEVDVRPDIALPALDSLRAEVEPLTVPEAEVDERLEALRVRFGTLTTVERPAATGDFVAVDLRALVDGEEVDAADGVSYEVGSGTMLEGTDDALVGLSAGEETTFTSVLRGGDHAGAEAEITVVVQSVKERVLPDVDDDFAALASEFDTVEELRADLRDQVAQAGRLAQAAQASEKVLDALVDAVEVPVPESLVAQEVDRHLEAEDRSDDEEHRAEVTPDAERGLRGQLLLDAVVESEQVRVSRDELVQFLVGSARQFGMEPNDFAKAVDDAGQVQAMVQEVGRRKALALVMQHAAVVDTDGATVELDEPIARQAAGVPPVPPQSASVEQDAAPGDEAEQDTAAEAEDGAGQDAAEQPSGSDADADAQADADDRASAPAPAGTSTSA